MELDFVVQVKCTIFGINRDFEVYYDLFFQHAPVYCILGMEAVSEPSPLGRSDMWSVGAQICASCATLVRCLFLASRVRTYPPSVYLAFYAHSAHKNKLWI